MEAQNLRDPMIDPYNQAKQLRLQVQELDDQVMQLTNARDELVHIGTRMAQELQEFIDAGKEGGSTMTATAAILTDWEQIHSRHTTTWQDQLVASQGDGCSIIETL